nr:two-component regulator propeller domain-containing protein [uncultured Pedobacter sp.]
MRCKFLLIVFSAVLFSQIVFAQQISNIQSLGIENGLSNNSVRVVFQDHNGYMWFGTHDGLNRYDGYEFEIFRNRINDSTSIPHNFVYTIAEDISGKLYVGTGQGVSLYDPLSKKFSSVYMKRFRDGAIEKIQNSISIIQADKQGTIYIGSNGIGLLVQQLGQKECIQIPVKVGSRKIDNYNISCINFDSNGGVWVFISDLGLFKYNPIQKELALITNEKKDVVAMAVNQKGEIWMGTDLGIYKYVPGTGIWSRGTQNSLLLSNQISSLLLDKNGKLWAGLPGKGLVVLNLENDQSLFLHSGPTNPSLTSQSVSGIFEDRERRKWIATLNGGINIVQPRSSKFKTIANNPFSTNSLTANFASTFYEDAQENLWIGTESNGFSIWNCKNNSFENYRYQANSNSLSNNWVTSIKQDDLGNTWIATFGGGINKFNRKTHSFKHYTCYNQILSLDNRNVLQLYEDKNKDLWATTYGSGRLYKYNSAKDKFEVFDQQLTDIYFLTEDRNGDFLAGNANQFIKIDRINKKHQFYEIGKPVRAIYRDRDGQLWLGTEGGGLLLFDLSSGKIIKRFSTDDGLSNNSILSILEDNHHNLWMSTFNGLIKFNTKSKKVTNYYQEDGLQSNQFFYRSADKLRSGKMVFGGVKGFNIFYPDSIKATKSVQPLFITKIKVQGKLVTSESDFVDEITKNNIASLRLPYDDAVISVDFATLEYSSPGSINYAYYLEGWDKGWNFSGKLRSANYTNLHEGHYVLHIKSTNTAGIWNDKEKLLKITVLPPWWRTWWAYFLYLAFVFLLIRKFVVYQRDKERLKFQVELADTKMAQEKELHDRKLSFFTHISHEFRTPLTLIINPIKEFLNSKSQQVETRELIVVYRNARRLLSLVDQLLHFQKANPDKLKVSQFNLVNFCKEVFLCFVQQAKSKNISFEFNASQESIEVLADKEKLEIAIFNLISNALKYTPDGGAIEVFINDEGENVNISVKDNGVGISEDVGENIFNRFYQVTDKENYKGGFGIGLYVVKEIMESHHGNVSYTSVKGSGTIFNLNLPKQATFDSSVVEYSSHTPMHTEERIEIEDTQEIQFLTTSRNIPDISVVSEKSTILLVDDNLEIRNYIKSIFENDYLIMAADSAEAAFEMIELEIPNLVITDVVMGEMSGVDLCQRIKEDSALMHIPVILLTSGTTAELKLKGIESGADDFITKPFDKEILVARVANLLRSRSNLHQHFYNQITLKTDDFSVSPDLKKFLESCIEITEKHLDDKDFTVKQLADELDMSHSALYKKVKLISGKSINEFIRFIRLRKVAQLFINTDCKVNEGAYQAGFNDIRYFREQFAKVFGMNPSEYIRTYRNVGSKSYKIGEKFRKPNL